MSNRFKIDLTSLLPKDVEDINNFLKQNPNNELLIKFNNTMGVSSDNLLKINNSPKIIFRVAGGYDEEREKRTNNFEYYENKNYYTRNELIEIIRSFELFEREINREYSDFELAYFIYNKLKRYITYTHFTTSDDSEYVNNLLGIIYRKASSYGFSLIFKEMMDRRGIKCHFVEGNNRRYAWNILEIKDKFYCLDLSYDSYLHHIGNKSDCYYFGVYDASLFNWFHRPIPTEVITDYNRDISQIENIDLVNIDKFFKSSKSKLKAFKYVRSDNTSFIISGLEIISEGSDVLYKYLYCDYASNGRMSNPKILISEVNFFSNLKIKDELIQQIKYLDGINNSDNSYKKQEIELKNRYASIQKYDEYIANNFLSIQRLEAVGDNNYIGYFTFDGNNFVTGENKNYIEKYDIDVRKYRRDDGSVFVIEKVKNINDLFYYNYYEFYQSENNYLEVEVNNFITDNDLLDISHEKDKYVANVFFYRKRLLKCVNEFGGYMGYCDYAD